MRILLDILHPAHVHVFRHTIAEVEASGGSVLITSRDKDVAGDLLRAYGLEHHAISTAGSSGLVREALARTRRLVALARDFRPDAMIGIMGVSIAPAGRILRVPAYVFYDTEIATRTNRVVYPLATAVVTPDCYAGPVRGRHVTYPGYHELAYLHPDRFSPDPARLAGFGIDPDRPYSVVRFVGWAASHDTAEHPLTPTQKRQVVDALAEHGDVWVSAEGDVPDDLADRVLRGPVEDVHHVVAHARALVGESATMAAEAAVLGVPSVFLGLTHRGYIDDLARYGLTSHVPPVAWNAAMAAVHDAVTADRAVMADRRQAMLADKVDVTAWITDFLTSRVTPA